MSSLALKEPADSASLSERGCTAPFALCWNSEIDARYVFTSFSVTSEVKDVLDFLKSNNIFVSEEALVESFLSTHTGIILALYDLPQIILENFGEVNMNLEIFSDPDDSEEMQELFLKIETPLSPEEADKKISKINRSWLFHISDRDMIFFNLTLKYL